MLIGQYKKELLETGNFDYKVEKLLVDSENIGIKEKTVELLEKMLL